MGATSRASSNATKKKLQLSRRPRSGKAQRPDTRRGHLRDPNGLKGLTASADLPSGLAGADDTPASSCCTLSLTSGGWKVLLTDLWRGGFAHRYRGLSVGRSSGWRNPRRLSLRLLLWRDGRRRRAGDVSCIGSDAEQSPLPLHELIHEIEIEPLGCVGKKPVNRSMPLSLISGLWRSLGCSRTTADRSKLWFRRSVKTSDSFRVLLATWKQGASSSRKTCRSSAGAG